MDAAKAQKFIGRIRSDRGQALIEFVLLLPMVFLLVVNVVNFGGFFFAWITVANATRVGDDYAIQGGASAGGLRTAAGANILALVTADVSSLPNQASLVVNVCRSFNGTVTTMSGTCSSVPADPEPSIFALTTVGVTYTYKPFIPASFQFQSLNVYVTIPPTTIHRRAIMRVLN